MKTVLLDVNVVLDVLLNRRPHVDASAALWAAIESGRVKGLLAAHAVTTIHYLVRKERGAAKARTIVAAILTVFDVAPVDRSVMELALGLSFADFEDAVTAAAARIAGCDCVVTRDTKDFRAAAIPCLTPEAVLPLIRR